MTNEEAIEILKNLLETGESPDSQGHLDAAISKSIEALTTVMVIKNLLSSEAQSTHFDIQNSQENRQEYSQELFNLLKQWRLEKANEEGPKRKAFHIFHDSVLKNIATYQPTTYQQLHEINGVGPCKLEQYGADVLEIITAYLGIEEIADVTSNHSDVSAEIKQPDGRSHDDVFSQEYVDGLYRRDDECKDCGEEISEERLREIPGVERCTVCQQFYENEHPESVRRTMPVDNPLVGTRDGHREMRGSLFGDFMRRIRNR